ncbi:hypothetical protein GCM10022215_26780 [Nocardioides fonticola]|uniref:Glycosyltransferase RgtA/B/C/D-like domain-containing protein n=1 Tax=Nocardioides fonticola TaxID=450363 RepID=A0ABP7XLZ7_9ACTN
MSITDLRRPSVAIGAAPAEPRAPRVVARALLAAVAAVAVQVLGYLAGWSGHGSTAITLYYAGLVALIVPFVVVLLRHDLTARTRRLVVVAYGVLMYVSWWATSPAFAGRFDETLHVATLAGIAGGEGWFHPNPMLPVSPHYPGLELATYALWWLTGLPPVACQALIAVLCRIVVVVALFALAERVSRSARTAGLVVLLYSASPQFVFFNAQYAYQTLALALLLGALALLVAADDVPDRPGVAGSSVATLRRRRILAALSCLLALAITHHLTSWVGAVALTAWAALSALGRGRRTRTLATGALAALLTVAAWTAVVGPLLADYLGPVFEAAGDQAARLLALDGAQRTVGADAGGTPTPLWELAVMAASVLAWLILLAAAGWPVLRGRALLARRPERWLVLGVAAIYPALLAARFAPTASEVADRSSTFVFLALALLVGCWLAPRLTQVGRRRLVGAPLLTVLILGGIILGGGPDWQRVPGPYLPGAEQRSIDATTIAAARWAGVHLPAGSRIVGDLTLDRTMADFAPVVPVTESAGDENPTRLFVSPTLTTDDLALLERDRVDFVVVDLRMAGREALSGNLFDAGDAFGPSMVRPSLAQLEKFGQVPGARVVLDGPIRVYDVRALRGEPQTFADAADPVLPGAWRPVSLALVGGLLLAGAAVGAARLRAGRRGVTGESGVRPSWLDGGAPTLLVVVLPVLVALGALAVPLAAYAWTGAAATAVVVLGTIVALRPLPAAGDGDGAPARRLDPEVVVPLVASAVLLVVLVVVASIASWRGLFTAPLPPAPPAVATSGTSAEAGR